MLEQSTIVRTCQTCGAPIDANAPKKRIYCSARCSQIASNRRCLRSFTCEQCGAEYQRAKTKSRFCSFSCRSTYNNLHRPKKRGGRIISTRGYVMIHNPNYPHDGRPQYVQEHRLVMEAHLGRPLLADEVVHHIDGIFTHNTPDNLTVMSQSEHMRLHKTLHRWSRDYDCCIDCGTTERKHAGGGRCRRCQTRHQRNPAFLRIERKDAWSLKYDQCVNCGTTERPHSCKGLCTLCYERSRNRDWHKKPTG
jgi:hypothetical protein